MKTKIAIISAIVMITVVQCYILALSKQLKETKEKLAIAEKEIEMLTNDDSDALSEWDVFTLALMKVESNYELKATSSVGAKGYFQIMPIYVEEVNRVHKTNYVYEDVVRSFEQSYEVFTLMQEAHNKDFSMDKALRLHNGNHKWYHRRVYNEMSNIQKYEEMRQKVKNVNLAAI